MLARKNAVQSQKQNPGQITLEKARLTQARTLSVRRQDWDEVKRIDAELEALAGTSKATPREATSDLLAKVNERNRRANMEAVRKAEMMEVERKRRERQLALSGVAVPHDPSARLKTIPRLFNSATPSRFDCFFVLVRRYSLDARSGTPNPIGTPVLQAQTASPSSVPPLPPSTLSTTDTTKSFEAVVIESIELDLGDF